jgi:hypothetical protein
MKCERFGNSWSAVTQRRIRCRALALALTDEPDLDSQIPPFEVTTPGLTNH